MEKRKYDIRYLLCGQSMSIVATRMLKTTFTLYILDYSQSAATLGTILAFSILPMIFLSPFSGSIIDRINRKKIMIFFDSLSSVLVLLFMLSFLSITNKVILIGALLICLSVINTFETPTVQATIPLLVDEDYYQNVNAMVSQVHSVSNLIGPFLGGVIYSVYNLMPTVFISMLLYGIAAIIESFIVIKDVKQSDTKDNVFGILKTDLSDSINFLYKKQPIILRFFFIIALYNMLITSMLHIGLPYILKIVMGTSDRLYGFTESFMAAGAIIGGFVAAKYSRKINISKLYIIISIALIGYIPLIVIYKSSFFLSFCAIEIGIFISILMETIFDIVMMSYIQLHTPDQLMGKIFSLNMLIVLSVQPIGELAYGYLFEIYRDTTQYIIFFSLILGIVLAVLIYFIARKTKE